MIVTGTRRTHRALVALVIAAIALGACGRADEDEGRPELGPLPTVRSESDLVLPLDHYLPTPQERASLATARSELTARCMERLGFAGYPVDSYAAQAKTPRHGNQFGVIDEDIARRYGYLPSFEAALDAQSRDLETRFADWTSPAVSEALNGGTGRATSVPDAADRGGTRPDGVPEGGCLVDGPRELYASVGETPPTGPTWVDTLESEAFGAAWNDSRLSGPIEAWSRCMKAAGYDYATPSDATNDQRWAEGADEAGGRKAAVTDVHCKWSSGYLDTLVALVTAYQDEAIEKNAERLQQVTENRQRLLATIAAQGLGRIREPGER